MDESSRTAYLFLVTEPGLQARQELVARLRELGAVVVAEYGDSAVEALATPLHVEAVRLAHVVALRGAMSRDHLEKVAPEARPFVELWNRRFTAAARKRTRDRTDVGRSWGSEGRAPERPHSAIEPSAFLDLIERVQTERGIRLTPDEGKPGTKPVRQRPSGDDPDDEDPRPSALQVMSAPDFTRFEQQLAKRYQDETTAYHLARLGALLGPEHRKLLLDLPEWLLDRIWELLNPEGGCWRMTGEQSVGIVFVESSRRGGPTFTTAERGDLCNEILTGLRWLAEAHPAGDLRWAYDFQFTSIDVADGDDDADEAYWRDAAMQEVVFDGSSYGGTWSAVADYREDMRNRNRSEHAFVVFVTPYGTSWHAYAGGGRLTLADRGNWGGWGRGAIDAITAHEVAHLYGAADEYTGSGTPCSTCGSLHGCDQVPNGNCGACAAPQESCVMDGNAHRACSWTRGHIGWSHLFVELRTADEDWAGTDDDVWLDIGTRSFVLDNADIDDRERGNVQGYAIWAPSLRRDDIKRIMIRKSGDGFAGGWRLARVRVWFRGELLCDRRPDQWLEDDRLTWVGCVFDRDYVSSLQIRISTADVMWAGTDDDVSITLAGRTWNLDNAWHDDFERGSTDTFDLDPGTDLRRSAISTVRIRKSPDGIAGGWKLKGVEVVVDGASLYDNQGIDRWLEDDQRSWVGTV